MFNTANFNQQSFGSAIEVILAALATIPTLLTPTNLQTVVTMM